LYYSDNNINWTLLEEQDVTTDHGCGEYNRYINGGLGHDSGDNGNHWTVNNLAATDQMIDTPTNNFAVFSPLLSRWGHTAPTFSEGNTKIAYTTADTQWVFGSMSVPLTGKWYFETFVSATSGVNAWIGICDSGRQSGSIANSALYAWDARKDVDGVESSYGASWTSNDLIGVAVDIDASQITFYKNNASQGVISLSGGEYLPYIQMYNSDTFVTNFGQDSSFAGSKTAQGNSDSNGIGDFYYTPPTGFLALCTKNLPEPEVIPSEHFNTVLYTGTGAIQDVAGVGFPPDLVWIKDRAGTDWHWIADIVRGAGKHVFSNSTSSELTSTNKLTAFNEDGFDGGGINGNPIASWNWKANGSGVSNTDGSITSTVSANVDAGFSIVSYTGTGSAATVGHGLSVAPNIVITKNRSAAVRWPVVTRGIGLTDYQGRYLEDTLAFNDQSYNISNMSASLLTLGNNQQTNQSANTYISYAFHSVEGYSKFGTYTGNYNSDGAFVHCGFKPAYIMIKATGSAYSWYVHDTARDTYNYVDNALSPDTSAAEAINGAANSIDIVSNGFKLRTNWTRVNDVETYIFLAFAETPFKHSTAR